jgi:hypothetical protein
MHRRRRTTLSPAASTWSRNSTWLTASISTSYPVAFPRPANTCSMRKKAIRFAVKRKKGAAS